MADAAEEDFDLHVGGQRRAAIKAERGKRRGGAEGGEGFGAVHWGKLSRLERRAIGFIRAAQEVRAPPRVTGNGGCGVGRDFFRSSASASERTCGYRLQSSFLNPDAPRHR
jgi:hypothetical protein